MRRLAGVWAAAFAAFVIVIAASWALTAWHDRRLTIENAQRHVGATARLMAAHAERAIEAGDKVLISILSDRNNQRPSASYGPRLHLQLKQLLAGSPQLGAAWLLDAEGMLVADTWQSVPVPVSFARRSYFRAHREGKHELLIEASLPDAIGDRERFTLSRAIRSREGAFRGVVVVGIYSDHFADLYRDAEALDNVRSSLHLLDGSLLASWPPLSERFDPSWLMDLSNRIQQGEHEGSDVVQRESRSNVVGWRRLAELPVFVSAAQPVSAALADWHARAAFGGILALGAIGGFGVIAWRGWRGARAEAAAQQALREAYDDLDRRIAERTAALAESEALAQRRLLELEALYADAPVGLALFDRDLRVLRINEALASAVGLPAGKCLGRPLTELLPDISRVLVAKAVLETGEAQAGFEVRGRSPYRPEIERVWIEDYYPVKDAAGTVTAVGAIYRDITERVRAEDALRESDQRVRLAQEAGGMGLWDWDMKTGSSIRSDSYYGVWGLPAERFARTSSFLDLVLPADRARAAADMAAAMEGGKAYHSEFRVPQPDGAIRWLELRGEVRRDETGEPVRMIGVCFDVTARKLAEERMKMLAAEVDHRSKNVLAIVQSVLQLTRAKTVEEFRTVVHGRVAALGRAHGLLSESRWEGAELRRIVEDELAPYRGGGIGRVQITGAALLLPPGLAQALSVALHELATNAAKYGALSSGGGRVQIEWMVTDGWLRLSWQEQGGPPVTAPRRRGFGSLVIERVVKAQLEGDVRFDWRPSGLLCAIAVPLHHSAEAAGISAA